MFNSGVRLCFKNDCNVIISKCQRNLNEFESHIFGKYDVNEAYPFVVNSWSLTLYPNFLLYVITDTLSLIFNL